MMKNSVLIKSIKKDKTLPKYIKNDLVKIIKSDLYTDTLTIVSTLDKSPRSIACVQRFNLLDPTKVRTKQQVLDFKNELTNIKNECLKCTINPYFFISTKSNRNVRTLGDIMIPNSKNALSINKIVINSKYDYLDKPRMIKDYLITWNRDAKKYLENKIEEDHEYLAKSHHTKYSSFFLKFGAFASVIATIALLIRYFSIQVSDEKTALTIALLATIAVVGCALVVITNGVVNSFHSRKLRKYDKQMRQLDRINDRYADHTFDVEEITMKRVYAKKLCDYSLEKMNVISPVVKKFDIDKYVYSQKHIANRKYGLLKVLAFLGFVACIVCAVIMFSL